MAKGTLTVRIVGDAKSFSNTMSKTSRDLAGFGKKVAKVGLMAGAAAVAGIGVVGTKLVAAGEAAATANARIENITDQMGLFGAEASKVSDRLVQLSEKQARQTGMTTDSIKESKALLMTFSEIASSADEVGGVFDRAGQAALDMAGAGFGSATDNAKQLGKALNDPIKGISALSRSGVTFTETEKERIATLVESNKMGEAQTLILEAIEKQVGGTAEATADASAQLKETWGQAVQQIGVEVLPAFQKVVTWLTDRIPAAVEMAKAGFQRLRGWWDVNGPAIRERVAAMADAVRDFWENKAKPAIDSFVSAVRDNWPSIQLMMTSLGDIVRDLGGIIGEVMGAAADSVGDGTDDMEGSFGSLIRSLATITEALAKFVSMARKASEWTGVVGDVILGKSSGVSGLFGKAKKAMGFRANGGNVTRGPWLVGERGPEVVQMGGSGRVTPVTAGSGGSVRPMNVTVNMPPGANGDDVVRALQRWSRVNGPVPVAASG